MTAFCPTTGKQRYCTPQNATAVLRIIQRRPDKRRALARVYRCKHCGGYHCTTTPYLDRSGKHLHRKRERMERALRMDLREGFA